MPSPKRFAAFAALALTITTVLAAAVREPGGSSSSCTTVLGSELCTWAIAEGGIVTELGATIPMKLVEVAPTDAEMVWPPQEMATIQMPAVVRETLGIDHFGLNWEAHGHPPATFMTEHFDFHFYSLTTDVVNAIDCADQSKPADLPAGYALPDIEVPGMGTFVGLCVPHMGMHGVIANQLDRTDPFDADMLIGYYGAKPIFFEPMVSRKLLLSRQDFTLPMPQVSGLPAGVRYPGAFRAEYDSNADAYRLVFTGFGAQ